jgi:hypothetical protein
VSGIKDHFEIQDLKKDVAFIKKLFYDIPWFDNLLVCYALSHSKTLQPWSYLGL